MTTPKKTSPALTKAKAELEKARQKIAELEEYTKEKVAPVVVHDAKSIWGLPLIGKIVVGVIVLIVIFIFVRQGCNKRAVDANQVKVEQLQKEAEQKQVSIDSLKTELNAQDKILEDLYNLSEKSTKDRIEIEEDGQRKRENIKKITDDIKIKISDPKTTDSERDAIERELLRARNAAKVPPTN